MRQWQHRVEEFDINGKQDMLDAMTETLDALGRDGWELVGTSTSAFSNMYSAQKMLCFLKKPAS